MRTSALLALALLVTGFGCATAPEAGTFDTDLAPYFADCASGCFVLLDVGRGERRTFNAARSTERFAPCSTFKIPNALIGLETGVIAGADFGMTWDGTVHERPEVNRDHTLTTAIRHSVVWYFQELARGVGDERMQAFIDAIPYGNRDLSGGLTQFWLGSSLAVSADEQVEFLRRLTQGELPFSERNQAIVREILTLERDADTIWRGKTGSHRYPDRDLGWFVGWVEGQRGTHVFACSVEGTKTFGPRARAISRAILVDLGLLGPAEAGG